MRNKIFVVFTVSFIIVFPILLFVFSEWSCPSLWGSYKLGNNLYMIEWDNNCRIIVYNDHVKSNTCYSGAYIIPNYESDSTIRVIDAKSNKHWVVVKAFKDYDRNKLCYFLIDKSFELNDLDWQKDKCDSIIQSYITCFDDLQVFEDRLCNLKIKLSF